MIVRKLRAVNFRSFKDESFETRPGGLLVAGGNGSGKSSWIYVLVFALYGSVPDLNIGDLLSWGEQHGEVAVWFETKRGMFRATREFDNRSSRLSLEEFVDGEFVNIGGDLSSTASEKLMGIFPVPQDVFNELVVKQQGEFGSLTETTPAGRYRLFKQLADIEVWEKYGKRNEELLSSLTTLVTQAKSNYESACKTIEAMGLKPLDEVRLAELNKTLNDLEKSRGKLQNLASRIKIYWPQQLKFVEAKKFIGEFDGFDEYYAKWQQVKHIKVPERAYDPEEEIKLEAELKDLSKARAEMPEQVKALEITLKALDQEVQKLEEALITQEAEAEKTSNALAAARAEIESRKIQVNLVSQGRCPTCDREFDNFKARVAKMEEEIDGLLAKIKAETEPNFENASKEVGEIKALIKTKQNTKLKSQNKINELTRLQNTHLVREQDIKEHLRNLAVLKKQNEDYKERRLFLEEYPFDKNLSPDEAYKKLIAARSVKEPEKPEETSIKEVEDKLGSIQEQINQVRDSIFDMKSKAENFEYQERQKERAKKTLAQLVPEIDVHEKLKIIYGKNGAPRKIIQKWIRVVEVETNRQLERLTQSKFSIRFNDKTDTGRDTIDLEIIDNATGSERKFKTLSGGERTRVNIALALALSNSFSDLTGIELQTLWLDEVYGLDEGGQQEFAQIIEEVAREKEVVCATSCFESMSLYFENILRMHDGRVVSA